jgi:hypothetical protein
MELLLFILSVLCVYGAGQECNVDVVKEEMFLLKEELLEISQDLVNIDLHKQQ